MTTIITIEKLKIYNNYRGSIDGFVRSNRKKNKEVFGDRIDDIWFLISGKLQDIELISKRLASQEYTANTLTELREICDVQSFGFLTDKIKFYKNFQSIADILQEIKINIRHDTATTPAGFDSVGLFVMELNQDIENIKLCNFETLNKINTQFVATSTYQELSISNGWNDDYLKLAERFETIYADIVSPQIIEYHKRPWWKFW